MRNNVAIAAVGMLVLTGCGTSAEEEPEAPATEEEETEAPATEEEEAETPATEENEVEEEEASPESDPDDEALTMEAVEDNDSEESCWTVIDDVVYDVTDWISQHPGGAERILGLCGADGTAQFEQQHEGDSRPGDQLEEFELGPVE